MPVASTRRIREEQLTDFCIRVFRKLDVSEEDARVTAEILVTADLQGIVSHGVAHLPRYADGLRRGLILARPRITVVAETPTTATLDAGAGLGPPVSARAMQKAIDKALASGIGFVAVRNSNHYGIAGYYARMALAHDCIGMSMTNGSSRVAPTFGRRAALGTNPIAVAAPAGNELPFVLDMATSAVAQGKVEIADQLDKPIPPGWAIDKQGLPATDAHTTLADLKGRAGAALLPLGGEGELMGGHKGFGLALWVDIFAGLLSGAAFATGTYPTSPEGKPLPANLGHIFGAWRIDCFRPVDEFKADLDELERLLKDAPKAQGQERIYIHGEKEHEAMEVNRREGVPVNAQVLSELGTLGRELDVAAGWD